MMGKSEPTDCLGLYRMAGQGYLRMWRCFILQQKGIFMSQAYCVKCKQFFGKAQWLNMCSVCYKTHNNQQKLTKQVSNFQMPEIPEAPPCKQNDHSRCYKCSKKIGLLGYLCKGCECSYCNGHRLPENHQCQRDYSAAGKNEMRKNSINITAPKIQKIE